MKKLLLACTVISLAIGSAFAGEKDDAIKMVNDAAAAVAKDKTAAIGQMNDKGGPFVKGELYVFAYDLNGTMAAHPINAKLVGKNLLDVPDATGKLFRKDIIQGVQSGGSISVEYKYKNPKTGKVEDKVSYCEKAADLAVCAGYYK